MTGPAKMTQPLVAAPGKGGEFSAIQPHELDGRITAISRQALEAPLTLGSPSEKPEAPLAAVTQDFAGGDISYMVRTLTDLFPYTPWSSQTLLNLGSPTCYQLMGITTGLNAFQAGISGFRAQSEREKGHQLKDSKREQLAKWDLARATAEGIAGASFLVLRPMNVAAELTHTSVPNHVTQLKASSSFGAAVALTSVVANGTFGLFYGGLAVCRGIELYHSYRFASKWNKKAQLSPEEEGKNAEEKKQQRALQKTQYLWHRLHPTNGEKKYTDKYHKGNEEAFKAEAIQTALTCGAKEIRKLLRQVDSDASFTDADCQTIFKKLLSEKVEDPEAFIERLGKTILIARWQQKKEEKLRGLIGAEAVDQLKMAALEDLREKRTSVIDPQTKGGKVITLAQKVDKTAGAHLQSNVRWKWFCLFGFILGMVMCALVVAVFFLPLSFGTPIAALLIACLVLNALLSAVYLVMDGREYLKLLKDPHAMPGKYDKYLMMIYLAFAAVATVASVALTLVFGLPLIGLIMVGVISSMWMIFSGLMLKQIFKREKQAKELHPTYEVLKQAILKEDRVRTCRLLACMAVRKPEALSALRDKAFNFKGVQALFNQILKESAEKTEEGKEEAQIAELERVAVDNLTDFAQLRQFVKGVDASMNLERFNMKMQFYQMQEQLRQEEKALERNSAEGF